MIKEFWNIASFIGEHPLARRHRLACIGAMVRWQLGARLLPGPAIVPFANGARLFAERGMTGATGNIYTGLHEFEDMGFLLHFLRPEDLFVDVGANVGSYTVLAAAGIGARTISFEPVPATHEWLRLNVALNNIEAKVDRRQLALGDKPGAIAFTLDRGPSNRVSTAPVGANQVEVPIATLDSALAGQCPLLIKIDVEGYETAAIAGAEQTLARPELKAIIMEFNGQGAHFGYDEAALRQKLAAAGFEEFSYEPFERKLIPIGSAKADNILMIRDRGFVERRLREAPPFTVLGERI